MLLPYRRSLDVYLVQHSTHIRTHNILNYVTCAMHRTHTQMGSPTLFYNMIYTHHSHININDLLNKFPIICNIRKCVEWGRAIGRGREKARARPMHFHSFVDLFHLDVFLQWLRLFLSNNTHSSRYWCGWWWWWWWRSGRQKRRKGQGGGER